MTQTKNESTAPDTSAEDFSIDTQYLLPDGRNNRENN